MRQMTRVKRLLKAKATKAIIKETQIPRSHSQTEKLDQVTAAAPDSELKYFSIAGGVDILTFMVAQRCESV